jgi:hypothetical protein
MKYRQRHYEAILSWKLEKAPEYWATWSAWIAVKGRWQQKFCLLNLKEC